MKVPTIEAANNQSQEILKKHAALMSSRKILIESASEETESEAIEGEGSTSEESQNKRQKTNERDQEIVQSKVYKYHQIMFNLNVTFFL